jgi:hypothetical protein
MPVLGLGGLQVPNGVQAVNARNARHIRRGILLARRGRDGGDAGTFEILSKLNRAGVRAWGRTRFPGIKVEVTKVRRPRLWEWVQW